MLDAARTSVATVRQARKEPLAEADVRDLLALADSVTIARGRSVRTLPASAVSPDDLRGPAGGFRAPILRIGRRLLVGFDDETLREALKGAR